MQHDEQNNRDRLRLDEKHYRDLLIYLPEGVAITDLDENLIFVNDEFASMLGYDFQELLGRCIYDLIPEEERSVLERESVKRAVGVSSTYSMAMIRKDGGKITVKISGVPRRDDDDNVIGTMAVISDITVEREREIELLKLYSAIEASPTSVVITDLDGTIEYVNPKFSELTGYSSKEALGKNPRVLKSDLTPPETYDDLWGTLTSGKIWYGRFINRKKNGELYWEEAWISPILNPEGKATHYVAVKEDITRSVIAEEKLQLSLSDLELYTSFLQHDLRNDLQVLMSHAEGASMIVEDGSRVSEYLSIIQAASERMVNLLDVFVRPAEIDEVDIVEILNKSIIRAEKAHPNLRVVTDVEATQTKLLSARLIPMVFDNLLRNAAEYAEKDVLVKVRITDHQQSVNILLSDNGPGIPPAIEGKIFEKGASTTGGGLGLYLTKKVIEGYGGTIEYLHDMEQPGTTFQLQLPVKPT